MPDTAGEGLAPVGGTPVVGVPAPVPAPVPNPDVLGLTPAVTPSAAYPEIDKDTVFSFTPYGFRRPETIQQDGPGGVSGGTYLIIKNTIKDELRVRMKGGGIPETYWNHPLIQQVGALMLAANLCRKHQNFRDHADSLFADANIKYRLFFLDVMGYEEGMGGYASGVLEIVAEEITDTQFASSASFLSVFDRIRI